MNALDKRRLEKELQILSWLNEEPSRNGGYFSCYPLGILHVWWQYQKWQTEWIALCADPIVKGYKNE